jgi:broad specificity phosphatase PhoE
VNDALVSLAATSGVRSISEAALGQPDVAPETLLWVLLALVLWALVFLIFVPKARLAVWSTWYFFMSGDKKCRKPDDRTIDFSSPGCKRKKIVFIRHGESEWNAVFNVGSKITLPLRLVKALVFEMFMLFDQDSLFFDSPLSSVGIQQAWELLTFLASQPAGCIEKGGAPSDSVAKAPCTNLEVRDLVSIIRGDVGSSIMVSSILRRAISTGLMCLSPRLLDKPEEKVMLMTSLQEISRNVDTLALTPPLKVPTVPRAEGTMKKMGDLMTHFYRNRLDKKLNHGNKTLKLKAVKRQEAFAKWVFEQKEDTIIVAGHSLWFREFFKSFLPKHVTHQAKTTKMVNCGVVAFDFYKDGSAGNPTNPLFGIDRESIKEVRGGFEQKGKEKKV